MFSNGINTQTLRLQQFTRTISKFRNRAMAISCKPSTKLAAAGAQRGLTVPGERSEFVAPMFETEVFRKQMYCMEEIVRVALLGLFGAPRSDLPPPHSYLAPGELCPPCPPRYVPARRWIEPDQRTVPNQCSNIRSFPGPSLSAHAKFERPRHPKQRVLARRDFYFRTARIVIVTHRSANQKENAGSLGSPGLPDLLF